MLELLREPAAAAESRPQPSLAQLDELVASTVRGPAGAARAWPATSGRCRAASSCPSTASSRRRSRTCSSTPAPRSVVVPARLPRLRGWTSRSSTTAPGDAGGVGATAWSACASASRCSAASSRRGDRAGGGFRVAATAAGRHEHPRPDRRRPGAVPHRLPAVPRDAGRDRGRRRGGRRRARRSSASRDAAARRRPDGHPHAAHGRRRGDGEARRRASAACSCSRPSTSTSTSSARCAPAPPASCSRTRRASAWSRRSASSTPARRCSRRRSPAG